MPCDHGITAHVRTARAKLLSSTEQAEDRANRKCCQEPCAKPDVGDARQTTYASVQRVARLFPPWLANSDSAHGRRDRTVPEQQCPRMQSLP